MQKRPGLNQTEQEVEVPQVFITDRSGAESVIPIRPGTSLMQTITDAGVVDLLALCGGVCSCATCHVYIHGLALTQLLPMEQDEDDLLACSAHRQANSRLSCQIRLRDDLDGLRATIAPEDC
jgi:2Fe-2S ferredoxin